MFTKRKMSENDPFFDETPEGAEKIPVTDRRRFNEQGEPYDTQSPPDQPAANTPPRSRRETELESLLKAETERREAAEAKLVNVQAKFDEVKAGLEKETADMRSRMMKTLEDRARQGQLAFLKTLLPVLDNLNLAIGASEKDPSVENLRDGVKGTARSFEQALKSVGVESVPGVGSPFDPELHEAIDMASVEPEKDGQITAEYSGGYRFGDQLLRAARVQVGRGVAPAAADGFDGGE